MNEWLVHLVTDQGDVVTELDGDTRWAVTRQALTSLREGDGVTGIDVFRRRGSGGDAVWVLESALTETQVAGWRRSFAPRRAPDVGWWRKRLCALLGHSYGVRGRAG